MSKKIQLQIPTPCHEDWNKMTTVEKGKFCLSCQKEVIDFTEMTDGQVISFFKKPTVGTVCGRFQQTQLNRDILQPKKPWPFVKYFFQISLPAFLISLKAEAQKLPLKEKVEIVSNNDIVVKLAATSIEEVTIPEELTIKGTVKNENGHPVCYATIMIKGTKTGTVSDSLGNFSLKIKKSPMLQTLVASSVGFTTTEKIINTGNYNSAAIILMQMNEQLMGDVAIIAGGVVSKKRKRVSLIEKIVPDTIVNRVKCLPVFNSFKIYPNPVSPGTTVTIESKKIVPDDYIVEIISQNGQAVYSEAVTVNGVQKISINMAEHNYRCIFPENDRKAINKNLFEKNNSTITYFLTLRFI